MFLHRAFATVEVIAITARHRILPHILLNRRALRIETLGNDRTAEIAVGNYPGELPRLLVDNHRDRSTLCSHIMLATSCAVSPGTQQVGLGVITSFTFIAFLQVGVAQVQLPVPGPFPQSAGLAFLFEMRVQRRGMEGIRES